MVNCKPAREVIQVHWSPLLAGRYNLNVDGSCKTNSRKITAGGLLRDSNGAWILELGILRRLSYGVFLELQMAWAKGTRFLDVECDSLSCVSLITKASEQAHLFFA